MFKYTDTDISRFLLVKLMLVMMLRNFSFVEASQHPSIVSSVKYVNSKKEKNTSCISY